MADPVIPNNAAGPLRISARTIVDAVKTVLDSGKLTEFLAECQQKDIGIVVEADVINFVKGFLLDHDLHKGDQAFNMTARDVIISPQGRCP
jgi:hypothetical protein